MTSPTRISGSYVHDDPVHHRVSVYSRVRGFDIGLGGLMIALGLGLLVTGDPIQVGTEGSVTSAWSPGVWVGLLLTIGMIRWIALLINGRRRQWWSALVRSASALLGALFWTGVVTVYMGQGDWLNVIFFSALAAGEVYCSLMAFKDATLIYRVHLDRMRGAATDGAA